MRRVDTVGSQGGTLSNDNIADIVLAEGVNGAGNNFGELTSSSISGQVYNDLNNNGVVDDYGGMSGTSMAAPYVAGAAVIIRQAMQFAGMTNITQDMIYDHMMATADTLFDVRIFNTFAGLTAFTEADVDTKTAAVFGDFTYDFTDQFSLSLGGRYTWDKREASILRQNYLGGGSPVFGGAGVPFGTPGTDFEGSRKFNKFTPRASLTFKSTPDHTLYASYSQGFKGGGFDPRGVGANAPDLDGNGTRSDAEIAAFLSFRPEKVESYELGYKGSLFDGGLNVAIAGFYADYTDVQIPGSVACTVGGLPEHHRQQVLRHATRAVFGDQVVEVGVQGRPVGIESRCGAVGHDLDQCRHEGARDGGQTLMVVRLEASAEARQADGVHRQLLQVAGHVDGVVAHRRIPAGHQCGVDLQHRRVVVPQPGVTESGQEHVVGLLPVRLTVEGGEQPVTGQWPDPRQRPGQVLGEPGLVAEFLDEFHRAGVQLPHAAVVAVEQRPVQLAEQVDGQRVGPTGQIGRRREPLDRGDVVELRGQRRRELGHARSIGRPGPAHAPLDLFSVVCDNVRVDVAGSAEQIGVVLTRRRAPVRQRPSRAAAR